MDASDIASTRRARPVGAPDPERTSRILERLCRMMLAALALLAATAPFASPDPGPLLAVYAVVAAAMASSIGLLRAGWPRTAELLAVWTIWLVVTGTAVFFGGSRSPSFFAYFGVVLFAGVLWSPRATVGVAALSIGTGFLVVWADSRALLPEPVVPVTAGRLWVAMSALVGVSAGLLGIAMRTVREAFEEAQGEKQAAIRATAEVERRVHQQAAVAQLGQQALEIREPELLLDEAVRLVADTLEVEYCKVLELTPQRDALLLRSGVGWKDGLVGSTVVAIQRRSQAGYTLECAEPVVVEDFARETRFTAPEILREHGVTSGISCVIGGRGRPWGVLGAHSRRPRRFSRADAHFIQAVGNVLWAALEHGRLDRELHRAEKLEAVGRLAGGVAHDFNNMLTVIAGQAELLAERKDVDRETEEAAGDILATAHRAARLTRQLLTFGQRQHREPQRIDLNEVLRSAQRILESLAGESVELRMALGADDAEIFADPAEIEQVLLNLVSNARDAMPKGGTLTLETSRVPRQWRPDGAGSAASEAICLAVTDSGVGMEPDLCERIFEPFFTTKPPGQGMGLGLASVYGIVEQAGGELAVQSEPGRGTRFEVLLPPVEMAAGAENSGAGAPDAVERGSETVLLVEDEAAVRKVLRRALETHGYAVVEASHGGEALELLETGAVSPDVVVTDLVMPRLGGVELAERLQSLRPGVPVLLISGYDPQRRGPAELPPGTQLLTKPFAPRDLVRRVRAALDR